MSDIRLTIIKPINEPMGKIDWIVILAHWRSQYRPRSEVMVKSSTLKISSKVTDCALVNHSTCLLFMNDTVSCRSALKGGVHVDVGCAEKDEDSLNPDKEE